MTETINWQHELQQYNNQIHHIFIPNIQTPQHISEQLWKLRKDIERRLATASPNPNRVFPASEVIPQEE